MLVPVLQVILAAMGPFGLGLREWHARHFESYALSSVTRG